MRLKLRLKTINVPPPSRHQMARDCDAAEFVPDVDAVRDLRIVRVVLDQVLHTGINSQFR